MQMMNFNEDKGEGDIRNNLTCWYIGTWNQQEEHKYVHFHTSLPVMFNILVHHDSQINTIISWKLKLLGPSW